MQASPLRFELYQLLDPPALIVARRRDEKRIAALATYGTLMPACRMFTLISGVTSTAYREMTRAMASATRSSAEGWSEETRTCRERVSTIIR
jgi:hypothetical protein